LFFRIQKANDFCVTSQLVLSTLQKNDSLISAQFTKDNIKKATLNVTGKFLWQVIWYKPKLLNFFSLADHIKEFSS